LVIFKIKGAILLKRVENGELEVINGRFLSCESKNIVDLRGAIVDIGGLKVDLRG